MRYEARNFLGGETWVLKMGPPRPESIPQKNKQLIKFLNGWEGGLVVIFQTYIFQCFWSHPTGRTVQKLLNWGTKPRQIGLDMDGHGNGDYLQPFPR